MHTAGGLTVLSVHLPSRPADSEHSVQGELWVCEKSESRFSISEVALSESNKTISKTVFLMFQIEEPFLNFDL